jgi:DNA-binding GntR family transcriptional regulator
MSTRIMEPRAVYRVAAPLRQQVVQQLRQSIIMGEYQAGDRLIERVLCERYQVSRTVVREALRQMESEALVEVVPSKGPVVTTLTPRAVDNLYEVREALEVLAAMLFADRATNEQRGELRTRLSETRAAHRSDDPSAILAKTENYYATLLEGSANDVLHRLFDTVHARISLLRGISMRAEGRLEQSLKEFEDLTAAAVEGDARAAGLAAQRHVRAAASGARTELAMMPNRGDGDVNSPDRLDAQSAHGVDRSSTTIAT